MRAILAIIIFTSFVIGFLAFWAFVIGGILGEFHLAFQFLFLSGAGIFVFAISVNKLNEIS